MSNKSAIGIVKVPELSTANGDKYLSANIRAGGSYLTNYHKKIPQILIGSVDAVNKSFNISCTQIVNESVIVFNGYIANEYLCKDLRFFYKLSEEDYIELEDRVPYSDWVFSYNAYDIYQSGKSQIDLKITGTLIETNKQFEYIDSVQLSLESGCYEEPSCIDKSITECALRFNNTTPTLSFRVVVNGIEVIASSFDELKEQLLSLGIECKLYDLT